MQGSAIDFASILGWILTRVWIFIEALIYAGIGLVLLFAAYKVFDKFTPTDMNKAIFEENKVAVAIAVGAFILGIALIISAAIVG